MVGIVKRQRGVIFLNVVYRQVLAVVVLVTSRTRSTNWWTIVDMTLSQVFHQLPADFGSDSSISGKLREVRTKDMSYHLVRSVSVSVV